MGQSPHREDIDLGRRLLEYRTGLSVAEWNHRIRRFHDESALRRWLNDQDVTGYAQMLLVIERFGDSVMPPPSDEMVDALFADRAWLRPAYDRVIDVAGAFTGALIAAQPTHVSMETWNRQFAVIKPTTPDYLELAVRLPERACTVRFTGCDCSVNSLVSHSVRLTRPDEVDAELTDWLRAAHAAASAPLAERPLLV